MGIPKYLQEQRRAEPRLELYVPSLYFSRRTIFEISPNRSSMFQKWRRDSATAAVLKDENQEVWIPERLLGFDPRGRGPREDPPLQSDWPLPPTMIGWLVLSITV